MQAYLQVGVQEPQSADSAPLHLAHNDSPLSSEQQPAEPLAGPLELPADAGSLQRHASHNSADGQQSLEGATWLAAFMEAHLQGHSSSREHADIDQADEGSEASSAETNSEAQSAASSNDQSDIDFDDQSDNDNEELDADFNNDESNADSDDEAYHDSDVDPCPLPVRSQLWCTITGQVQRLASTAVGLGYHAAGAAYGSILGLRSGTPRHQS